MMNNINVVEKKIDISTLNDDEFFELIDVDIKISEDFEKFYQEFFG